jgi:cellulose biosynthesis protein BcsQ/DNA-binding CsgD family transcriptional regulator
MSNLVSSSGQVITFYSYKGGTGRSMALANVGILLAQKWSNDRNVLLIDWDLEAPGLHRFFENNLVEKTNIETKPGLIDFFSEFRNQLETISDEKVEAECQRVLESIDFDSFISRTTISSLYLMTAGRFDETYPSRVNSFNWESFFNRFPWAIRKFAEYLSKKYQYILIDSRTGITDTSGICTTLLPEKLVVVFTPNNQSLTGVLELIRNATEYRKQSDDLRPLIVFPLVSRVEPSEPKLREDWRLGNVGKKIKGYQQQFETLLKSVYDLPNCNLKKYFDEVQIQQAPHYAYGEEIAVLVERASDRFSLTRSYENLTQRLVFLGSPWESLKIESEIEEFDKSRSDNLNITKKSKLRIFLSYASADIEKVQDLYERLVKDGFDPWLDKRNLLPGQDWTLEIRKAVKDADVMIVCLSRTAVRKEGYVQKELRYALDMTDELPEGSIFIIPIRLEETEVPAQLKYLHWVDYFSEAKEYGYRQMVLALNQRAKSLGISTEFSKGLELSDPLTHLEWDILRLAADGKSSSGIAKELGFADSTIRSKLKEIYRSIDAKTPTQAVEWFKQNAPKFGFPPIPE